MIKIESLLEEILALLEHTEQIRTGGALNREQAATYLGISVRTLHELVARNEIKRVAVSAGRYVFRKPELDRYLKESEEPMVDSTEAKLERLLDENWPM